MSNIYIVKVNTCVGPDEYHCDWDTTVVGVYNDIELARARIPEAIREFNEEEVDEYIEMHELWRAYIETWLPNSTGWSCREQYDADCTRTDVINRVVVHVHK